MQQSLLPPRASSEPPVMSSKRRRHRSVSETSKSRDSRRHYSQRKSTSPERSPQRTAMYFSRNNAATFERGIAASPYDKYQERLERLKLEREQRLAGIAEVYSNVGRETKERRSRKTREMDMNPLTLPQKKESMLMFSDFGGDNVSISSGLSEQELLRKKKKDEMKRKGKYGRLPSIPKLLRTASPKRRKAAIPLDKTETDNSESNEISSRRRQSQSPSKTPSKEPKPTKREKQRRRGRSPTKTKEGEEEGEEEGWNRIDYTNQSDLEKKKPLSQYSTKSAVMVIRGDASTSTTSSQESHEISPEQPSIPTTASISFSSREGSVSTRPGSTVRFSSEPVEPIPPISPAETWVRAGSNSREVSMLRGDVTSGTETNKKYSSYVDRKLQSSREQQSNDKRAEEKSPTSVITEASPKSILKRRGQDPIAAYQRSLSFKDLTEMQRNTSASLASEQSKTQPEKGEARQKQSSSSSIVRYYPDMEQQLPEKTKILQQQRTVPRYYGEFEDDDEIVRRRNIQKIQLSPPRDAIFIDKNGIEVSPIRPESEASIQGTGERRFQGELTLSPYSDPVEAWERETRDIDIIPLVKQISWRSKSTVDSYSIADEEFSAKPREEDFDPEFVALVASIVIQTAVRRFLAIRKFEQMIHSYFRDLGMEVHSAPERRRTSKQTTTSPDVKEYNSTQPKRTTEFVEPEGRTAEGIRFSARSVNDGPGASEGHMQSNQYQRMMLQKQSKNLSKRLDFLSESNSQRKGVAPISQPRTRLPNETPSMNRSAMVGSRQHHAAGQIPKSTSKRGAMDAVENIREKKISFRLGTDTEEERMRKEREISKNKRKQEKQGNQQVGRTIFPPGGLEVMEDFIVADKPTKKPDEATKGAMYSQRTPKDEEQQRKLCSAAATRIQSVFRGWWVRDSLHVDHYCATLMQKMVRGHMARVNYHFDLYRIVVIQCFFRRMIAEELAVERLAYVISMQSFIRGHLARKRYLSLKSKRKAPPSSQREFISKPPLGNNTKKEKKSKDNGARRVSASRCQLVDKRSNSGRVFFEESQRITMTQIIGAVVIQTRWRAWWQQQKYLNTLADILIVQSIVRRWVCLRKVRLSILPSGTSVLGMPNRGFFQEKKSWKANDSEEKADSDISTFRLKKRTSSDEAVVDAREAQEKRDMKEVLSRAKQLRGSFPEKGYKKGSMPSSSPSSVPLIHKMHPSKSWSSDKAPMTPLLGRVHSLKSWSSDNVLSNSESPTKLRFERSTPNAPQSSLRARKAPSAAAIWKEREKQDSSKGETFVPSHGRLF